MENWQARIKKNKNKTKKNSLMHDVKYPMMESFCKAILLLFLTNIDDLLKIRTTSFIFKMKVLIASMTLPKTVLFLNLYLPCSSDTLQAPKICPVVYTSLLHKVHMVSVVILHLLKLVGDESVSYVEAKQKKVRLAGIAIKESQNKSC